MSDEIEFTPDMWEPDPEPEPAQPDPEPEPEPSLMQKVLARPEVMRHTMKYRTIK